jgi:hypothetical protein
VIFFRLVACTSALVYLSSRVGRLPPWPPDAHAVSQNPAVDADDAPLCSAKGCRRPAAYELLWRNPRIHGPDRTKQWLACADHRTSLADFLTRRDFPLTVEPL